MTTIMQPFHCDLQPQIQEMKRTTHIDTTTRCRTQRRNQFATETTAPHPPHTRGTFHRRLQPLYTEKYKVSCSGFLPKTEPIITMHFAAYPSSPLPFVATSRPHPFPSSQLPLVTTSLRHHFPSSPRPFVTTYLPHHFPSSPLPFVTISQSHHTPLVTTSQRHHFPSFTTLP